MANPPFLYFMNLDTAMDTTKLNTDKSYKNSRNTKANTIPTNQIPPKPAHLVRHESDGNRPSLSDSDGNGLCDKESESRKVKESCIAGDINQSVDKGVQRANKSDNNSNSTERIADINRSPDDEEPERVHDKTGTESGATTRLESPSQVESSTSTSQSSPEASLSLSTVFDSKAETTSKATEVASSQKQEVDPSASDDVEFDPWLDVVPAVPTVKPSDNYDVGDRAAPFIADYDSHDKKRFALMQTDVYMRMEKSYNATYYALEKQYSVSGYDQLRRQPNDLTLDYELPAYLLFLSPYNLYIYNYAKRFPPPQTKNLISDMVFLIRSDMIMEPKQYNSERSNFFRQYWKVAFQNNMTKLDCSTWKDFSRYDDKDVDFQDRMTRLLRIAQMCRYIPVDERIQVWDAARKLNLIAKFITYDWFCKIGDFDPDDPEKSFAAKNPAAFYDRMIGKQIYTEHRRRQETGEQKTETLAEADQKGATVAPSQARDIPVDNGGARKSDNMLNRPIERLNSNLPAERQERLENERLNDEADHHYLRNGNEFDQAFQDLEVDALLESVGAKNPECTEVVPPPRIPDILAANGLISDQRANLLNELDGIDLRPFISKLADCKEMERLKKSEETEPVKVENNLDGMIYETEKGVVRVKQVLCDVCAVDTKIAMSDCDEVLIFYYSLKDKGKRTGMCALNKAHYLTLMSRGFANRTSEVKLAMLQFTTAYPYKIPTMFVRMVATPTMVTVLDIIQDSHAQMTFSPEKHVAVDSEFDTHGLVTQTDLITRFDKQESVNCWRIVSSGDKSPIMFKRDPANLEKMKYKRMTPHVRQNIQRFENQLPKFLKKLSGNLRYSIKGSDFIDYALDRCKAKMLSVGERIDWMANAMCAKELFENDPKGLYSLYSYSLYRCTKCFIKDETYDKTTTTLRNIISPDTFVKIVYGTLFRPYEDYIYYHSPISPHLIKKLNDQQVHDKLCRMKVSKDWVYGQYDSKAFESSYTTGMLEALYGDLLRCQDDMVMRNIVRITCFWNINPKIIRSRFFSIIYEDGQMSGFPHTACWNVMINVGDKVINCHVDLERDSYVSEGDDFMICAERAKVQVIADQSVFETTVLISAEFSDLSFCGHHYLPDGTRIPDGNLYDKLNTYWCHHEPSASELFSVGIMKALSYSLYYPGHPDIAKFIDDFNSIYSNMGLKLEKCYYEQYMRKQWWRIEQRSFPVFDYYPMPYCPKLSDRIEKYLIHDKFYECDSLNTQRTMTLFITEVFSEKKPWYQRLCEDVAKDAVIGAVVGGALTSLTTFCSTRNLWTSVKKGTSYALKGGVFGAMGGVCEFGIKEAYCSVLDCGVSNDVDVCLDVYESALTRGVIDCIEDPIEGITAHPRVRKYIKHFIGVRAQLENRLAKAMAKIERTQASLMVPHSAYAQDENEIWAYTSEFLQEARALRSKVRRRA